MSEETTKMILRVSTVLLLLVIAIFTFLIHSTAIKQQDKATIAFIPTVSLSSPENDFAGLWEATVNCPQPNTDPEQLHHELNLPTDPPAFYSIARGLDGNFTLTVSNEFAGGDPEHRDGWNGTTLYYCLDDSKQCDPAQRWVGEFDCDDTYLPQDSDWLSGTAEIHNKTHNLEVYLIRDPSDGSVSPVIGYEHEDGSSHRGVLH